jgi:CHAT domain-containing protein
MKHATPRRTIWCASLLLCLFPINLYAQQAGISRFENEDQFAFALIQAAKNGGSAELLRSHKEFVNDQLWQRLVEAAQYVPSGAQSLLDLALDVARDLQNQRLIGSTHYKIGWYEFGHGNISAAIRSYLQSKQAFENAGARRDLIYVLADLGSLHIYASDYQQAREYSEQSLALAEQLKGSTAPASAWPDEYGMGTALSNLGNISKRDGEYEKAIQYFQKSLAAYQKIDGGSGKYNADIIDDLADIGRTYVAMGDYVGALGFLNQSKAIATRSGDRTRSAGICNSLGILYLGQRDYVKAIDFFQQGLQLAGSINDRFKQCDMLLNLGVAYQFQRDFSRALDSFGKALELGKQIEHQEISIAAGEGIGAIYKEERRYGEALEALSKSLSLAKVLADKTRIAELLWRVAEVQYAKGDFAEAVSSAADAAALADQLSLRNVSYLALTTLGRAQRGSEQEQRAVQTFSRAIDQIESFRSQVAGTEGEQQLFFEDKLAPYHELVELLVTRQTEESDVEALKYAERAKGRVLFDVLSSGRSDISKVMTAEEKSEENRLNGQIVALNIRITEEGGKQTSDAKLLTNLNEELKRARLKYETFQDSVYASHPEVKPRRAQSPGLTVEALGELVTNDKTAVLEYVVTTDKVFLFVLTRKSADAPLDLKAIPIHVQGKVLTNRVQEFREMLAGRDPGFAPTARELYDLLIKPAAAQLQGKDTLCVVPDGILWELPFQALQSSAGQYLLQDHAIDYAPSLAILREMTKRQPAAQLPSAELLAFGNPRLGNEVANLQAVYRGESLAPLPEAETEVKALRDIWGPTHSTVLVGAAAGKKRFKAEASKYQIIHLATHGILDNENPMYSRLAMARTDNEPDDDGLLEAREIMQLNLHADLVVLSACQTARGRIGAGEGVIGMSWAFFVAGAPTLVVSQWKVDSASTARLMINFHRHLKVGSEDTKAQALRKAALELLNDKAYLHPFYWAGFVMIGRGI